MATAITTHTVQIVILRNDHRATLTDVMPKHRPIIIYGVVSTEDVTQRRVKWEGNDE
jgi:hypothetical protein